MTETNLACFDTAVSVYDLDGLRWHEESIIKGFFPKKGEVLDLGCGCGRTTKALQDLGYWVHGVDSSLPLIARAEEKYPSLPFSVMDARNLAVPDRFYDVVFFSYNGIDCIETVEGRHTAIQEMFRVLRPGGICVYTSHKRFWLEWPLMKSYPFVKVHYILMQLKGLISGVYRKEKHPFGTLSIYCCNDSSEELLNAGFDSVERIDVGFMCYYVGFKRSKKSRSVSYGV